MVISEERPRIESGWGNDAMDIGRTRFSGETEVKQTTTPLNGQEAESSATFSGTERRQWVSWLAIILR
jgi:hypothetical protein